MDVGREGELAEAWAAGIGGTGGSDLEENSLTLLIN